MKNIQEISDKTLYRLITDCNDVNWNFFALKVMISRLKLKLSMDSSAETIHNCCNELRELLHKSKGIPNAIKDLKIISDRCDFE
ncbi:MAG: hypothetical protein FWH18_01770 [Marinilabiliaceae bacterium]|nr:hypothetical protein [Marinilabiliaceae bacterium]